MQLLSGITSTTASVTVMLLRAILWTLSVVEVVLAASPCDQVHELTAGSHHHHHKQQLSSTTNVITIDSPNYPFTQYPPCSSCRHSIKAPLGYAITVQCNMNLPSRNGAAATDTPPPAMLFTDSNNCLSDFLYISSPATEAANDGYFEYFCGRGYVSRTSVFNTLTLAYESRNESVAGYFSCTAFATRQSCDCGWNPVTRKPGARGGTGRIIGGQEAVPNEYASMVALVDKQTSRVFCGGSISE